MAVVMLKMALPTKQELSEYVLLRCCLSTPVDCALGSKHGIFKTEMSEKVTKLKLHKMKDNNSFNNYCCSKLFSYCVASESVLSCRPCPFATCSC